MKNTPATKGLITQGQKYLVTTLNWFYGPNGEQFKAAYGPTELFQAKSELGFVPTRSANWYIKVGNADKHIIIAGCQVNYFLRTDERPTEQLGKVREKDIDKEYDNNKILFLDDTEAK